MRPHFQIGKVVASLGLCAFAFLSPKASAQSVDFMLNECSSVAQTYFRDFNARTEMRYNGQRTDGTHAIGGRILLETRAENFSCSYAGNGNRMVEFFAEGRLRNAFLPGGGDPDGRDVVQVTQVPSDDVLNVRSGPGTSYRIVGTLGNGDRVRRLVCQDQGSARWCQIEMMTDMRERGRVNARFLTDGATATQLPESPRPPTRGDAVRVRGLSAGGILNVRSGPGTSYSIMGALGNGSQVRNLGCEGDWCRIEMMTDMRERGWVSARYLGLGGSAIQQPSAPAADTGSSTVRVRFAAGSSGAELRGSLAPGEGRRYVLGARNGQYLYFRLAANGPGMSYQIFNPDRSLLLDQMPSDREYRGQLWQSGDHVIEVINRSNRTQPYNVIFGIQ